MANSFATIKQRLFRLLLRLSPLLLMLSLALAFAGCKADEVVVTQTETRTLRDTLRQVQVERDSIYLHDSIFVVRETRSDTIRETRYVYRYKFRDRWKEDSVRVVHHTDTVLIIEPDLRAIDAAEKELRQARKETSRYKGYLFLLLFVLVAVPTVYFLRKLKL